jgi:hypothetical protein
MEQIKSRIFLIVLIGVLCGCNKDSSIDNHYYGLAYVSAYTAYFDPDTGLELKRQYHTAKNQITIAFNFGLTSVYVGGHLKAEFERTHFDYPWVDCLNNGLSDYSISIDQVTRISMFCNDEGDCFSLNVENGQIAKTFNCDKRIYFQKVRI